MGVTGVMITGCFSFMVSLPTHLSMFPSPPVLVRSLEAEPETKSCSSDLTVMVARGRGGRMGLGKELSKAVVSAGDWLQPQPWGSFRAQIVLQSWSPLESRQRPVEPPLQLDIL